MQPYKVVKRFVAIMNASHTSYGTRRAPSLFDGWLQSDLQRLYDQTLCEPVPDDLLRLIPQAQEPDPPRS